MLSKIQRNFQICASSNAYQILEVIHVTGNAPFDSALIGINVREHLLQQLCRERFIVYLALVYLPAHLVFCALVGLCHIFADVQSTVKNCCGVVSSHLAIRLHVEVVKLQHAVFSHEQQIIHIIRVRAVTVHVN